jgi:catechol 2,3-dioxygenase-like lactoylglutathione lyase family enzyme
VGSLGEEAAKLFAALSGWAKDQGTDHAGAAAGAASSVADALHDLDEHVATGSEECRYCPVCRTVSYVRQTSPEVRQHLAVAASSLMHAAAGMLATEVPDQDAGSAGVERIDLDGAGWDDGPQDGPESGPSAE